MVTVQEALAINDQVKAKLDAAERQIAVLRTGLWQIANAKPADAKYNASAAVIDYRRMARETMADADAYKVAP